MSIPTAPPAGVPSAPKVRKKKRLTLDLDPDLNQIFGVVIDWSTEYDSKAAYLVACIQAAVETYQQEQAARAAEAARAAALAGRRPGLPTQRPTAGV